MHSADAFIQSDLQMHSGYTFSLVCVFPGNRTHNLLSHTGAQVNVRLTRVSCFQDTDLVPSDIAAGLALLHQEQDKMEHCRDPDEVLSHSPSSPIVSIWCMRGVVCVLGELTCVLLRGRIWSLSLRKPLTSCSLQRPHTDGLCTSTRTRSRASAGSAETGAYDIRQLNPSSVKYRAALIWVCVSAVEAVRRSTIWSEETSWAAISPPSYRAQACSTETSSTSAFITRWRLTNASNTIYTNTNDMALGFSNCAGCDLIKCAVLRMKRDI